MTENSNFEKLFHNILSMEKELSGRNGQGSILVFECDVLIGQAFCLSHSEA